MDAARLPEARRLCPSVAADETHAACRLHAAVARHDVAGGAQALADWIDAQHFLLAYLYMSESLDQQIH